MHHKAKFINAALTSKHKLFISPEKINIIEEIMKRKPLVYVLVGQLNTHRKNYHKIKLQNFK